MAARNTHRRRRYLTRMLTSLALCLLLGIGAVRLWPVFEAEMAPPAYDTRGEKAIQTSEVQPTRQASEKPPPPPPPLPPIAVPDDVVLDREELDFDAELFFPDATDQGDPLPEGPPARAVSGTAPDKAPKQLKLVEPEYSRAARKEGIRARVVVEVFVKRDGTVSEARIVERALLNDQNEPTRQVAHLGYGLEEAALEAARRTTFFPARAGGEPVKSRTTITIRFGV